MILNHDQHCQPGLSHVLERRRGPLGGGSPIAYSYIISIALPFYTNVSRKQ